MKTFTKTIEDFTCLHCGHHVHGDGYTNHCPNCLWSRDVDINPGDRASKCGGAMRPIGIETAAGHSIIIHICEKCGKRTRIRARDNDNIDAIITLSADNDFLFGKK
ncbi:MAG: RNHCP domain-containing protein [Rickettsiales bacterium]|jgi:Zn finger protein HypA/HybF involved in hydrogenase expression|nr:RNHCP domain-containing protein [Rickettsiales bacterium]